MVIARLKLCGFMLLWIATLAGPLWAQTEPAVRAPPPSTQPAAPSHLTLDPFAESSNNELLLFQDIPVVVAAGKRVQTQRQAAASVSIVTADDIELFGYRSLADVLRNQRGFYLHTDGLNWFAGERGFLRAGEWNARMMVLVDGRPTNDLIFGQSHLDQDFVVPMEAVKRVEIVRGPGSALYGGNAVFSVIDVITKSGADVNGVQVKLTGGTQDTGRANILMGTTLTNGLDVIADISAYTSNGDSHIHFDGVDDAAHNFGHIDNSDYQGVESAFLKAHYGDFTLSLNFASRDKDNATARYLASFFNPGSMYEARHNITLSYDHEIADGQSIHAKAYYSNYTYHQHWQIDDDGAGNPYQYTSTAIDNWLGEEVFYDWQTTDRMHFLVGGNAAQTIGARQRDFDSVDGELLDSRASFNQWGVFGEAEYKFSDKLTLTAGLRFDHMQRIGECLSPRFAAVYTPTNSDTLKALYGRAFRAPNLFEMFYAEAGANTPNPNLVPEIVAVHASTGRSDGAGVLSKRATID